jgi:hypothetical protein
VDDTIDKTEVILGWCISLCGFVLDDIFPNKNCMLAMCNIPLFIAFVFLYQTFLEFSDLN